jgi:hypothetical protein
LQPFSIGQKLEIDHIAADSPLGVPHGFIDGKEAWPELP